MRAHYEFLVFIFFLFLFLSNKIYKTLSGVLYILSLSSFLWFFLFLKIFSFSFLLFRISEKLTIVLLKVRKLDIGFATFHVIRKPQVCLRFLEITDIFVSKVYTSMFAHLIDDVI